VLLLLDPDARPPHRGSYGDLPLAGALHIVPDEQLDRRNLPPLTDYQSHWHNYPSLLIGETAAREMLTEAGLNLDELRGDLAAGERIVAPTGMRIDLEAGLAYEETTALNVAGYLPAADIQTAGDRILVVAPYTGPPAVDGAVSPGADENASGVAVVLEVARLWHELGFEPKRTVVFAALDVNGGPFFINHPPLLTEVGDTWTVVILDGLGAGVPEIYRFEEGGSLARILDQSARRFGVDTRELDRWSFFFRDNRRSPYYEPNPNQSGLAITRPGDDLSGTHADTLDHLDARLLAESGMTIAHYLMVLANR
jgi:hypothetical protein